jgi:Ca2+-binding EF-hand superfamily protein
MDIAVLASWGFARSDGEKFAKSLLAGMLEKKRDTPMGNMGAIDSEETERLNQLFAAMDTNGNGKVTKAEVRSGANAGMNAQTAV